MTVHQKDKFKCYHCGWCCQQVKYSSIEEFDLAKEALSKLGIELSGARLSSDKINWETPCPAFDVKIKRCLIYKVRPYPCRAFLCGKQGLNDNRPWRLNGHYNQDYFNWLLKNNKEFYEAKKKIENEAAEWANTHGWSLVKVKPNIN